MTQLPVHPRTGLTALGMRRDGHPIWPVMGGDGSTPPPPPAPPAPQPPAPTGQPNPPAPDGDKPLGPAGEKALQEERDARKALEKAFGELKTGLASVLGVKPEGGKTDLDTIQETLKAQQETLAKQSLDLLRRDVADEKELSKDQAAMLVGTTKEELTAHADKLIELFGKGKKDDGDGGGKGKQRLGMKPDPAQGSGGGGKTSGAEAGRAAAAKRFGSRTAATT